MVDTYQICPYTGLRSFTEEESLYFKGREDDIDQATAQLQRNKFLMLTGASGDGKSSLVYAGIIPNARSGFLKSKYSQWSIADFRPERTPFHNLVKAVSRQLDIPNESTVQAELQHGFSALADLYKNSKRYIDVESATWIKTDDATRAAMKRGASNLIILVDQFEEFFTNPENYHQGSPSKEANLVLNLLLETTRIALEEDLPIYVIFTMRSDYIGQCAAFRGLPEYIGFSQFFVPRLNRAQLQMVIEEPAVLSGNRITRRLAERLIHDLTEGVDQLPILQHALNQVWVAANEGAAEMDLIHYAMVGGMAMNELPEEQVPEFSAWFEKLPPEIKACYHAPSLQNVLDTHTNKLYEQAADYYHQKTGKRISREDAQLIIRTTFTCLTKIDQGRAVRNRMTLTEITHILGQPGLNTDIVGSVLNVFREPGNTFIRPFINPELPETNILHADQVLDITHESLIRNWLYLGQWAKEEFNNHSVSLDFEQQLGRWVNSGKSNNFLLPIGPLTYFETWNNKVKPNAWWIARYLPDEAIEEQKFSKANEILNNGREFLSRSASKHVVTRTIMRYGPKRIGAILGLFALLMITIFGIANYLSRRNESVLKNIKKQVLVLATNPSMKMDNKITLVVEALKQQQVSINEVLAANEKPIDNVNLATGIATLLTLQGNDEPKDLVLQCLGFSDSTLATIPIQDKDPKQLAVELKEINDLRVVLEIAFQHIPDPKIREWQERNVKRAAQWALFIAKQQPEGYKDIQQFSLALEYALGNQGYTSGEVSTLLSILSTFENANPSKWLQESFQQDKILERGELGYGFPFNGRYQEMAYLYAAAGNSDKALQCIDTLLKYNQTYYQGDYGSQLDNASNIAAVFFSCGQSNALDNFVKGYCVKKKIAEDEFYARWLGRTLHDRATNANLELYFWMDVSSNINVAFIRDKQLALLFDKYRAVIQAGPGDADKKNLQVAISFKDQGIVTATGRINPAAPGFEVNACFDQAVNYYRKVSPGFLNHASLVIGSTATDNISLTLKAMFIYPDLRTAFHPYEPRSFFYFYFSDAFLEYIIDKHLFDEFFITQEDFNLITNWLHDYNVKMFFPHGFMVQQARTTVFKKLEGELVRRGADSLIDMNLLNLYMGRDYQLAGDSEEMLHHYQKLQPNNFNNILNSSEFGGEIGNQTFRMIGFAVYGLTKSGKFDAAKKVISAFKQPMNRSSLYAFAAINGLREKLDDKLIQQLIDSAKIEAGRAENVTVAQPNRDLVAYALAMQSPEKNAAEIKKLIKNIPKKAAAFRNTCRSYAFNGKLFAAVDNIPENISANDQADYLNNIFYGYRESQDKSGKEWEKFNQYYRPFITRFIQYVDENN